VAISQPQRERPGPEIEPGPLESTTEAHRATIGGRVEVGVSEIGPVRRLHAGIQGQRGGKEERGARTELEREQSASFGASSFFGLTSALQQAYPNIDPSNLIDIASRSSFLGDGETQRGSRVRGEIAVRVKQVMPNGDLYVEGSKVILVNEEELHIYVSGVVRPQDIQEDNSVRSGLIADAQVEFTGRGTLTDNQRQGWLARLVSALVP